MFFKSWGFGHLQAHSLNTINKDRYKLIPNNCPIGSSTFFSGLKHVAI